MELCDDEDFCSEDGEISLDLEQDEDANIQGENQAQVGDGNKELEQLEEEDSFGEHQEQNQYEANFPVLAPNAVKPKKWGPVQAARKSTRVDCTEITMLQRAQGLKQVQNLEIPKDAGVETDAEDHQVLGSFDAREGQNTPDELCGLPHRIHPETPADPKWLREPELPLPKDFWSKIKISEPLGRGAFISPIKKRDSAVKTSVSPVSTLDGCWSPQAGGPPLKTRRAVPELCGVAGI